MASDPQEQVRQIRQAPAKIVLLDFEKTERWQQDNAYIRGGYRQATDAIGAIQSIFQMHNETFNIWTHLLCTLLFGCIEIASFSWLPWSINRSSELHVFRVAAIVCFLLSSVLHTFNCISHEVRIILNKFDYAGITGFMALSGLSWLRIVFAYDRLLYLYSSVGGFFAVIICACILFSDRIYSPEFRVKRAILFCFFGGCWLVPFVHGHVRNLKGCGLGDVFLIGLVLLMGVGFYAMRFPECIRPGNYDLLSSHAIFHTAVGIGSWMFYCYLYALIKAKFSKS